MLTTDLIIYSGKFDGITIQDTTQFGYGGIYLTGVISVPENEEIVFLAGSHPELAADFHLIVDGNLTAEGTIDDPVIFDKYLTGKWYGIVISGTGIADFEYCEFTNAQFPLNCVGEVWVDNCEFYFNDRGIYLKKPLRYMVENTYIHDCGYFGLFLRDSHKPIYRSGIYNSRFTDSNYGLWFYNASAYVASDSIHANKYAGILANRGSNPVITNSVVSNTYNGVTDYPEIRISGTSYPVIDKRFNDITFGNSYSIYRS